MAKDPVELTIPQEWLGPSRGDRVVKTFDALLHRIEDTVADGETEDLANLAEASWNITTALYNLQTYLVREDNDLS